MISKFKEKFSRKNIKSVALKSATAVSRGVAVLASHASAAINTTAITESISAITGILPAMGDMVSAAIGSMMTIGIEMFCLRFFDAIPRGDKYRSSFWPLKRGASLESLPFIYFSLADLQSAAP